MAARKPPINLLRGWPNPSLLPTDLVQKAAEDVLSDKSIAIPGMLYGPDEGDGRLREALAKWLSDFYIPEQPVESERITITGGASQNLGVVAQTFTDPVYTRNVWIVSPTYMLVFRILDDAGLHHKLRAVPEDEQGIDVEYLRREIEKSERQAQTDGNNQPIYKPARPWQKFYKHLIYAVPTHSNPSSKITTLLRRQQLIRLAREYDALIITDDVYDHLQWHRKDSIRDSPNAPPLERTSIPRLIDVDRTLDDGAERQGADGFGNAISNGSFSKILGPGVRTGWVEAAPKLALGVSQTGTSRSGGAPSHLTATFIARLLEEGSLQRHVFGTLQPAYERRWRAMMGAIEDHLLPLGATLPRGTQAEKDVVGGYFVWLTLPVNAVKLAKRAKEEQNLIVAEGAIFEVPGDRETANFPNNIRLCFAWEDEDKLAEGIERLARVLKGMLADTDGDGTSGGEVDEHRERELQSAF